MPQNAKSVPWPKDGYARNLSRVIAPYVTLVYADGKKAKRNILLLKNNHGSKLTTLFLKGNQVGIDAFFTHQDATYAAVNACKKRFGNNMRAVVEAFCTTLDKLGTADRQAGEWLSGFGRYIDDPKTSDRARQHATSSIFNNDSNANEHRISMTAGFRFAAQCYGNSNHLVLPGAPESLLGKEDFSSYASDLNALIRAKIQSTLSDQMLDEHIAKWAKQYDENHDTRHSFVSDSINSLPSNVHLVPIIYGGDHTRYGFHEHDRTISRKPFEEYFNDVRLFVCEPKGYQNASPAHPKGLPKAFPQQMKKEELLEVIMFNIQHNPKWNQGGNKS